MKRVWRRWLAGEAALRQANALGKELFELLLRPVLPEVQKSERLLFCTEGALSVLPFGALVSGGTPENPQYLADLKPIHTTVSATVYTELLKAPQTATPLKLAALGDPAYPQGAPPKTAGPKIPRLFWDYW